MFVALLLLYSFMIFSQRHGALIIQFLHGTPAMQLAMTMNDNDAIRADAPLDELCIAYEKAHVDTYSNILHASAMMATIPLLFCIVVLFILWMKQCLLGNNSSFPRHGIHSMPSKQPQPRPRLLLFWLLLQYLLYVPPLYYIPAWIGHFVFQRDIPAVFTYGMTWHGLRHGETCAWMALVQGRALDTREEYILSAILASITSTIIILIPSLVWKFVRMDTFTSNNSTTITSSNTVMSKREKTN